jgi:hypothetical protein
MADHTALLTECEKAIQMVRSTVPMTGKSEDTWESLHRRIRDALGMPKLAADDHKTAWKIDFIKALETAGVPDAQSHAELHIQGNPGIEDGDTPQQAANEWIDAAGDAIDWKDPARYGAS